MNPYYDKERYSDLDGGTGQQSRNKKTKKSLTKINNDLLKKKKDQEREEKEKRIQENERFYNEIQKRTQN